MVFRYSINLAGINVQTVAERDIPCLAENQYFPFLTRKNSPDVFYEFHKVEQASLTLPRLNPVELRKVNSCLMPASLDTGIQDISYVKVWSNDDLYKNLLPDAKDPLNVPLFRSKAVRDHLITCLDHPEQVYMMINALAIEMRDFLRRRSDLFYIQNLETVFLDELVLRRILVTFLADFQAALIHSSAVLRNDKVALFLGTDGAGKSTVASLDQENLVLSDDRNIIRKEQEKVMVHGTPWGLITNGPVKGCLGGLFLIEKASEFSLQPIPPREVIQFLWEENAWSWEFNPKDRRQRVLDILVDACHQAPCYRMRFPRDFVDWDAIDAAMAK